MTRGLPAAYLDALQEEVQAPVWLFQVHYDDPGVFAAVTNFSRAVEFPAGGQVYTARPVRFDSGIVLDALATDSGFDVRLGDEDKFWRSKLDAGGTLSHRPVKILRADTGHLSDATRVHAHTLFVENWTNPQYEIVLNLRSFRALLKGRGPTRRATRKLYPGMVQT